MQKYLIKNLKKGFIKLFNLAYLLLILFIKKKDKAYAFILIINN
jgi:hypothetical protein